MSRSNRQLPPLRFGNPPTSSRRVGHRRGSLPPLNLDPLASSQSSPHQMPSPLPLSAVWPTTPSDGSLSEPRTQRASPRPTSPLSTSALDWLPPHCVGQASSAHNNFSTMRVDDGDNDFDDVLSPPPARPACRGCSLCPRTSAAAAFRAAGGTPRISSTPLETKVERMVDKMATTLRDEFNTGLSNVMSLVVLKQVDVDETSVKNLFHSLFQRPKGLPPLGRNCTGGTKSLNVIKWVIWKLHCSNKSKYNREYFDQMHSGNSELTAMVWEVVEKNILHDVDISRKPRTLYESLLQRSDWGSNSEKNAVMRILGLAQESPVGGLRKRPRLSANNM